MVTIEIIQRDGHIAYSNVKAEVALGEEVQWTCVGGTHFSIHFDPLSPLERIRLRGRSGVAARGVVNGFASPGRYKYFVAVFDGDNIWTDDPELIVVRRERGPESDSGF